MTNNNNYNNIKTIKKYYNKVINNYNRVLKNIKNNKM